MYDNNFLFTPLFCCCFWIRDPRSGIWDLGSGIRDINIPDPQYCGAQVDRYNITITSINLNSLNILAKLEPKSARTLEGQLPYRVESSVNCVADPYVFRPPGSGSGSIIET